MRFLALLFATLLFPPLIAPAQQWSELNGMFGGGAVASGNTYRFEQVRTDLQVQNSNGMLIPPEMGLISTAIFVNGHPDATVRGDICLTRSEFDTVIRDLREGGLSVTSLGVRFAGTDPGIYFLGYQGRGQLAVMGRSVKRAFDEIGKERLISEGLNRTGKPPVVDWAAVQIALGLSLSRVGSSSVMRGATSNGRVAFGGCPCGRTMAMGHLQVVSDNLQALIDCLRAGHISVTAIARFDENYTVDFEAEGDALQLAIGLRKSLNLIGS